MICKNCGHELKKEKRGLYHYNGKGQGTTRCHEGVPVGCPHCGDSIICGCEKPEAVECSLPCCKLKPIEVLYCPFCSTRLTGKHIVNLSPQYTCKKCYLVYRWHLPRVLKAIAYIEKRLNEEVRPEYLEKLKKIRKQRLMRK